MTTMCPGDLWIANIPFTDYSTAKRRPVLILWLDGQDAVVAAVTSATPRTLSDVPLADWRESGLRVPSTVRLARLDCLEQSLLLVRLGQVGQDDARHLREVWSEHIKPQF
jgi:mRNA interferase MazF